MDMYMSIPARRSNCLITRPCLSEKCESNYSINPSRLLEGQSNNDVIIHLHHGLCHLST